jgi:hypothetical protein
MEAVVVVEEEPEVVFLGADTPASPVRRRLLAAAAAVKQEESDDVLYAGGYTPGVALRQRLLEESRAAAAAVKLEEEREESELPLVLPTLHVPRRLVSVSPDLVDDGKSDSEYEPVPSDEEAAYVMDAQMEAEAASNADPPARRTAKFGHRSRKVGASLAGENLFVRLGAPLAACVMANMITMDEVEQAALDIIEASEVDARVVAGVMFAFCCIAGVPSRIDREQYGSGQKQSHANTVTGSWSSAQRAAKLMRRWFANTSNPMAALSADRQSATKYLQWLGEAVQRACVGLYEHRLYRVWTGDEDDERAALFRTLRKDKLTGEVVPVALGICTLRNDVYGMRRLLLFALGVVRARNQNPADLLWFLDRLQRVINELQPIYKNSVSLRKLTKTNLCTFSLFIIATVVHSISCICPQ